LARLLLAEVGTAEIMPRFRNLGTGAVQQKTSAADLVTEADVSAERAITAALLERFSGSRGDRRGGCGGKSGAA
jgi:fructose-1,6-bisphosphatase/inositol monophosphatase family enzyme